MNETLRVKVEADIAGFEKGLSDAERELKRIERSIGSTSKELKDAIVISRGYSKAQEQLSQELKEGTISQKQYASGLQRLQRDEKESQIAVTNLRTELRGLKASYRDLGGSTQTLTKDVGALGKTTQANAVPAMTSFSQIIQDSPYGIQGVANNIQQLTMQMGYLSNSTGSTGGALKAMLSTLTGPTGILLAVSLVTTLLVKYGDKLMELVGSTNKLADATKEFVGEAMAEVSELKVLIDIANNHEASIVARRKAIEEINSKYGEYLGNIDEESIKTDKVKDSINQLTRALIQQAQIKGLKDVIGEETANAAEKLTGPMLKMREAATLVKQEINNLIGSNDLLNKRLGNIQGVNNQIKAIEELGNEQSALGEIVRSRASGVQYAIGEYNRLNSEIKDITSNTADAIKPFQELQQALTEKVFGITVVPEFDQEEIVITGTTPKLKVDLEVSEPHNTDILDLENDTAEIQEFVDNFYDADAKIREKLGAAGYEFRLNEAWNQEIEDLNVSQNEFLLNQQARMQEHAELMGSIVGSMISNMSNSLMQGQFSWENFAKSVINSVGQIVAKLVAQAVTQKLMAKIQMKTDQGVANANAGVIATNAATALGPAGIVALPGLLAGAAGMVNGFYGGIGAFADGGIVGGHSYSGDKILARLNSGELILNQQQQAGVLAQMNAPTMTPTSGQLEVVGYSMVSGEDIMISFERSQNRRNRIS